MKCHLKLHIDITLHYYYYYYYYTHLTATAPFLYSCGQSMERPSANDQGPTVAADVLQTT